MVVPARVPAAVWVGTSRLGEIPADNLSYGVKATAVCFRHGGGKAPTRRNLGAASLISFVMLRVSESLHIVHKSLTSY
jgi:hypothetical protein